MHRTQVVLENILEISRESRSGLAESVEEDQEHLRQDCHVWSPRHSPRYHQHHGSYHYITFLSVFKKESQSDYNSYKLFGVDFFLDDAMKPWLLELNNFPSMEKASLDRYVNDPMIAETYNVAGFHFTGKPTSKQKQVSYMTCSMIMSSLESEP